MTNDDTASGAQHVRRELLQHCGQWQVGIRALHKCVHCLQVSAPAMNPRLELVLRCSAAGHE